MKAIAVLPARMGASRFPGKPMEKILGIPMIGHCYYRSKMCDSFETYVATCDEVIADYIKSIGGNVVMTSDKHNRATDRTAEALLKIEEEKGRTDVIVMLQGDEPLIQPDILEELLKSFDEKSVDVANIMNKITTKEQFHDYNNVKVVVNNFNNAMYFSREPIPSPWKGFDNIPKYNQVGVIAFRRESLLWFNEKPEAELEQIESIDMNRFLENGFNIRMVPTDAFTIGVDTKEELAECEKIMINDKTFSKYELNKG